MLSNEGFEQFKAERNAQEEHTTNIKDLIDIHNSMMQESERRAEETRQVQHENTITIIELFIPIISFFFLLVFLLKKYKTLEPIIIDKFFRYISIISSLALMAFILYAPLTSPSLLKKEDTIIIISVLTLTCINLFTLLKLSKSPNEDNLQPTGTNMLSNIIRRKHLEDEIKTLEAEKRLKELKEELHQITDDIETDQKNIILPPRVQNITEKREPTPSQDSCTNNPISHSQDSTFPAFNEELPQNSHPELMDSIYTKDEAATISPILSSKGLLSVNGRRRRKQYFIISLFLSFLHNTFDKLPITDELWFIILPPLLFVTYLQIANNAKRFHDLNKPTTYAVVYCILATLLTTFYDITKIYDIAQMRWNTNSLFTIVLLAVWLTRIYLIFAPGTEGSNNYGRPIEELKGISK